MDTRNISTTPNANEIWSGIGGHFDSLGQIINEFVDNSISNFDGHSSDNDKTICISLTELPQKRVRVQIEDTGTGIKDLDVAFTLGCRKAPDSPLNEHGFGLKHALATANPNNDDWSICTRTKEDVANNRYVRISSPYRFENFNAEIFDLSERQWEGRYNSTGTLINFVCSYELYQTLGKGIRGGVTDFKKLAALLYEDLGFVYSEIIYKARAIIYLRIVPLQGNSEKISVGALRPDWLQTITPGNGVDSVDLGKGLVNIEYQFGLINPKSDSDYDFDNTNSKKYYKASMSTSGVEIRINGRMICYNVFKEIWKKEKHNDYNAFLAIINLKSANSSFLPKTRTSKNGLRDGDPQLEKLYTWIFAKCSYPQKRSNMNSNERDMFLSLRDNLEQYNHDENAVFEVEHFAYTTTGNKADKARIDLYENSNGKILIYEGKKEKTTIKDVYQLRMYWDGLVYDGLNPDRGILVAREHPQSVKDMIQVVNNMKDMQGNKYAFIFKTWQELGMN